jgi:hypothetical protein
MVAEFDVLEALPKNSARRYLAGFFHAPASTALNRKRLEAHVSVEFAWSSRAAPLVALQDIVDHQSSKELIL